MSYNGQAYYTQNGNYSGDAVPSGMDPRQMDPVMLRQRPFYNVQPPLPGTQSVVYLNEKRSEALKEVDQAKFSRFHARVCFVAGVGFFTDAYDIFAINIASVMIGYIYGGDHTLSTGQDLGVKIVTQVGILFGQLVFGFLADQYGRRRMYGIELVVMVFASLAQALSGSAPNSLTVAQTLLAQADCPPTSITSSNCTEPTLNPALMSCTGTSLNALTCHDGTDATTNFTMSFCDTLAITVGCNKIGAAVGIVGVLVVWRFIMGVAIGGDYPLSAIITSEFAPVHLRGRLMAIVFSNQGLGQVAGAIVAIVVTKAARKTSTIGSLDIAWRILLGFGCVPGAVAFLVRYTIPESPRYIMDISRDVDQATQDIDNYLRHGRFYVDPDAPIQRVPAPKATWRDFWAYFSAQNSIAFAAMCYSWFILDFAYYGLSLNSATILQAIQFSPSVRNAQSPEDALCSLFRIAEGNLILAVAGLLPGYFFAILLIDRWGRKPIQFTGFGALFVVYAIMGFAGIGGVFNSGLSNVITAQSGCAGRGTIQANIKAYVFLYCLAFFFQNFGPNTTTFIIPGEAFPTRYRATLHGIASAAGKLGAIVTQVVLELTIFKPGKQNSAIDMRSVSIMFIVFAFAMLTGLVSTHFTPETKQKSLEEISGEDQTMFIKVRHNDNA